MADPITPTMLSKTKLALRISTNAFDEELNDLISAAIEDMRIGGITNDVLESPLSFPLIARAVITYVKLHFGEPSDPERLQAAYIEQKSQLMIASEYTEY